MSESDPVLVFTVGDIEAAMPDGMSIRDAVECVKRDFDCGPVFEAIQILLEDWYEDHR